MVVEKVGNELRFKNPGSLLMVVLGFLFWGVGFLDLLGHTSAQPDVFGLYSLPFFALIILYGLTISIWFALFINANLLMWVEDRVRFLQDDKRWAIPILVGLGAALWLIFEWDRWTRVPGLQFAAFGLVVLASAIFLLANWKDRAQEQPWRKIIVYPVAALLVVEILLQVLARFGGLPAVEKIGGNFYPYERIYDRGAAVPNTFANRYGWYYLDTKLDTGKKQILVVGGSYVQSLQVPPEQQFSAVLKDRIDEAQTDLAGNVELMPIGLPGFGLVSFLYEDAMKEMPDIVNADEMIVVFHLGDDFQSPVRSDNATEYLITESGEAAIDDENARLRHDLTHYYLRGYMSFQVVGMVRSNYLTPKVIGALLGRDGSAQYVNRSTPAGDDVVDFPRIVGHVSASYTLTEPGHAGIKTTDLEIVPGGNNFMFVQGGNEEVRKAVLVAEHLLTTAQEIAREKGIPFRVVTVPMFPEAFYESNSGGSWQPQVGDYDLFGPEKALVEVARKHGIPILPMGEYMLQDGLTVQEIRALYLPPQEGGFTPDGHAYFADAIYACFYSNTTDGRCSK